MKNRFTILTLFAILAIAICTTSAMAETLTVNVGTLRGPTSMGMADLMERAEAGPIEDIQYNFTISGAIDETVANIVKGVYDISAIPSNLAAVLYQKTKGDVKVLAINTLGILYIVENGNEIQSVEDLRGKTMMASGKGAVPEYILNIILSKHGIDPEKDITIEWKAEHAEGLSTLASTENAIAMLPQPFVTVAQMKNENIRVALDLNKLWEEAGKEANRPSALIAGVVVARQSFIDEHPEAIESFLREYEKSIHAVTTDTDRAAEIIGKYEIVPEPIAKKALPHCNIVFISGEEMQEKLDSYLRILFDQNPKSTGGKVPDEGFYYIPEAVELVH